MKKVERSIRITNIAELHDRYLLKGFLNFKLDNVEETEKQERLVQAIFQNNPLPPITIAEYIDSVNHKRQYLFLQGEQMVQLILGYIKRKQKPGGLLGDLDGLSEIEKRDFWSYEFAVQAIITDLPPKEARKERNYMDFDWILDKGVDK